MKWWLYVVTSVNVVIRMQGDQNIQDSPSDLFYLSAIEGLLERLLQKISI